MDVGNFAEPCKSTCRGLIVGAWLTVSCRSHVYLISNTKLLLVCRRVPERGGQMERLWDFLIERVRVPKRNDRTERGSRRRICCDLGLFLHCIYLGVSTTLKEIDWQRDGLINGEREMTLLLPLSERKPDRRPKSILEGIMGLGGKMRYVGRPHPLPIVCIRPWRFMSMYYAFSIVWDLQIDFDFVVRARRKTR